MIIDFFYLVIVVVQLHIDDATATHPLSDDSTCSQDRLTLGLKHCTVNWSKAHIRNEKLKMTELSY